MLVRNQGQGRLLLGGVDALIHSLALSFLQNQCIDGECDGWSWCEACGSALGFLAAAATELFVVGIALRGLSLSCPWTFVQLGSMVCNSAFNPFR